ncbi:hypothetical protein Tco_1018179 [Tanacetum coccineum]|uniref:Uncharacterized protein n=1 Tax=Tanacetum coccineum TaxID=301880 RepID=A0ABQ5FU00_9ASTR
MKTPISSDKKLTKDGECKPVDSTKYRGMIALFISTIESEYVSAGKACQQALWMKQALIDYDIQPDGVPIIEQVGLAGDMGSTNDVLIPLYTVLAESSIQRIHQLNTAYQPFIINTMYSIQTVNTVTNPTNILTLISSSADHEGLIEKVITETMTELTLEEYVNKTRGDYYSGITKTMINRKAAYELKGKFLDDLWNNAFSETNGEDAIEHIEDFLKIVDPLDLLNVSYEQLRLVVFPITLTGDASEWLMNEPQILVTTWLDLTELFSGKYYPPSRTGKIMGTYAKWDSTNVVFENWLALKFTNHMMMDPFTKNALWDSWKKGDNQEVLSDEAFFDLEETYKDREHELLKSLGSKPIYSTSKHLYARHSMNLIIFLKLIWIYLLTIFKEPRLMKITKTNEPFHFKNGKTKWPTCSSNEDAFCNGGELSGMVRVGYMTYFQDYKWYDDLIEGNLKEEALKQKAMNERKPNDDHSIDNFDNDLVWDNVPYDASKEGEQYEEDRYELLRNPYQEPPVCKIGRMEVIKYSFGPAEKCIAIKECEHDDWTRTKEDACRAYQGIFRIIDEGWFVTRAE